MAPLRLDPESCDYDSFSACHSLCGTGSAFSWDDTQQIRVPSRRGNGTVKRTGGYTSPS